MDTHAPKGLLAKIMHRIELEQRKKQLQTYRRLTLAGLIFSSALLVPITYYVWADITQSATWAYASLFFTDTQLAFANLYDISLGILETLPLVSLLSILTLFLCTLVCIKILNALNQKTKQTTLSLNSHTYAH